MEKLRNLSLKKTIILYTAVSLVCMFFLSAVIAWAAEYTQRQVWWKYVDEDTYWELAEGEAFYYMTEIPRPASGEMTKRDYEISEFCDFLETYTVLILSILGSCAAVGLFYKNKLKTPIAELSQASKNIGENNLDFQITYENKDEMGRLCREFERMRGQLALNNRKLWKMIEEEKTLRAAIAHDIRSPLSVLKGYQEMLMEYLPDETIDTDKAVEMLSAGMNQIERMDIFVEHMRKMSSLDKREMRPEEITAGQIREDIHQELQVLGKTHGKQCALQVWGTDEVFYGDRGVILEVTENLLSNALRYAKKQVEICAKISEEELRITVSDDGNGFGERSGGRTETFYRENVKDSLKHAGLGMYLSRLYCEKHGGRLLLENQDIGGEDTSGAKVTAVFRRLW